mgnify:CR=1 FL=1
MHKAMPIGVEDFCELRKGYYFVDKTRFIRQLLDEHSKVTLLTRPRQDADDEHARLVLFH